MAVMDLIEEYRQAQAAEAEKRAAARTALEERALARFLENCKVWLGLLLVEVKAEPVQIEISDGGRSYEPVLRFRWQGVDGKLYGGLASNTSRGAPPRLKLWVGNLWSDGLELPRRIASGENHGPLEYDYEAISSPEPQQYVALLSSALTAAAELERKQAERAEKDRLGKIEDYQRWFEQYGDLEQVEACLTTASDAFPEMAAEWQARAEQARKRIAARAEQVRRAEEEQAAREAEEARLLAEAQAFDPFTIYKVDYSVPGEESPVHSCYTAEPGPDDYGWFTKITPAREQRVFLTNVLSVTEIQVRTWDDVPDAICQHDFLRSDRIDGSSVYVRVLPARYRKSLSENDDQPEW